jgi:hypothetical protein
VRLRLNNDVSGNAKEGQEVSGLVAFPLAIGGYPQGGALNVYGDAVMLEAVQEGVDEVLPLEEIVPL